MRKEAVLGKFKTTLATVQQGGPAVLVLYLAKSLDLVCLVLEIRQEDHL